MLPSKWMMDAEADMGRRWQTVRRQSDVPLAGLAESGGWVPEAPEYAPGTRTNLETPASPTAPSSTCAEGRDEGREGVTNSGRERGAMETKQATPGRQMQLERARVAGAVGCGCEWGRAA